MQRRKALQSGLRILEQNAVPSAQLATELLLMHVLGIDRAALYTHPEIEISPELERRYLELIRERAAGKPLQYITGHQEFWGLDFEVNPDVLIPRPETEMLVESAIGLIGENPLMRREARLQMADVGTGSGCIALALAVEFPAARVFATDLSRPALIVAQRNASRLGLRRSITFVQCDLLECFVPSDRQPFDLVVANPPYVSQEEMGGLQREVRDFEPRLALGGFVTNDEIYRRLIPQAHAVLKEGGRLIVETGFSMSETIAGLLGEGWNSVEIRSDLAGIPRVVIARKQQAEVALIQEAKGP